MRKMNLAVGILIMMGFLAILSGLILQMKGLNLFDVVFTSSNGYFLAANTCFIVALVLEKFDKPE